MTPQQAVKLLDSELGLSTDDIAGALATDPRTIERWRSGGTYPQRDARRRLASLLQLRLRLLDTFRTPSDARLWLQTQSRYLSGLTPADVLRVGRVDRVEAALEALDSGIFL